MLPVRWMIPVGGVLFAITLLALAWSTPDGSRLEGSNVVSVRSGIMELGERPEWRMHVIVNAIQRRADELSKLRELPDTPIHTDAAPVDSKIAELPQTVPLDTALSTEVPAGVASEEKLAPADSQIARLPQTFPPNIADSLSIESPVGAAPEPKPESRNKARVKSVRHARRRTATAVKHEPPQAQNSVIFPFGSQTGNAAPFNTDSFGNQSGKPTTPKANNHFDSQSWQTSTPHADFY